MQTALRFFDQSRLYSAFLPFPLSFPESQVSLREGLVSEGILSSVLNGKLDNW